VAYAYAAMYPDKVKRLVVRDAPIPGIEPWNETEAECPNSMCTKMKILLNPGVWDLHFNLNFHGYGPAAERLVAGRERIYFGRLEPCKMRSGTGKSYQKLS
jgi:pimeloyl-ACP methyl ester carboxylesterase